MSCNGCRVLRKGCSETCILRPCLQWIENPEAQGHATVFVAKFFGRAGLLSFISGVPDSQRPALFQSLLFEACGRTVNPVNGAAGLLWTGNWHICQAAVETVLRGGTLRPIPELISGGNSLSDEDEVTCTDAWNLSQTKNPKNTHHSRFSTSTSNVPPKRKRSDENVTSNKNDLDLRLTPGFSVEPKLRRPGTPSEESVTTAESDGGERKILNLFV